MGRGVIQSCFFTYFLSFCSFPPAVCRLPTLSVMLVVILKKERGHTAMKTASHLCVYCEWGSRTRSSLHLLPLWRCSRSPQEANWIFRSTSCLLTFFIPNILTAHHRCVCVWRRGLHCSVHHPFSLGLLEDELSCLLQPPRVADLAAETQFAGGCAARMEISIN